MKDRIKAIMKDLNMSQGDFAKFLGISASILSSIFNGRTNPTLSTVALIKEKVPNISYSWLLILSLFWLTELINERRCAVRGGCRKPNCTRWNFWAVGLVRFWRKKFFGTKHRKKATALCFG